MQIQGRKTLSKRLQTIAERLRSDCRAITAIKERLKSDCIATVQHFNAISVAKNTFQQLQSDYGAIADRLHIDYTAFKGENIAITERLQIDYRTIAKR
jgi:hypothetical protein